MSKRILASVCGCQHKPVAYLEKLSSLGSLQQAPQQQASQTYMTPPPQFSTPSPLGMQQAAQGGPPAPPPAPPSTAPAAPAEDGIVQVAPSLHSLKPLLSRSKEPQLEQPAHSRVHNKEGGSCTGAHSNASVICFQLVSQSQTNVVGK